MRQFLVNSLFEIAVRARKSPWIETRKKQRIQNGFLSGLVRARGLKLQGLSGSRLQYVRARKSPWIETYRLFFSEKYYGQGS